MRNPIAHQQRLPHDRVLPSGLNDGVGDQVGERDLFRAGAVLQRRIEAAPAFLEHPDRQLAERGCGRNRQALVHVGDELGGGPLYRAGARWRVSG
jgi:hypothetical protein